MALLYLRMPTGYLPDEDQGTLMAMVQLPVGSTLEQTQAVMAEVEHHFLVDQKDAVKSCGAVAGIGLRRARPEQGMVFVQLKDWKLRNRPGLRAKDVAGKAMRALSANRGAIIFAFPPARRRRARHRDRVRPDGAGPGRPRARGARARRSTSSSVSPRRTRALARVRPNGMTDVPQYKVDVDWEKAGTLGVPVSSVQSYVSAAFGSAYVGNFVQGGRVKRVYAQADAPFRMLPERPPPAPRPQPAGRRSSRSRPSPRAGGSTARRASSATTPSPR